MNKNTGVDVTSSEILALVQEGYLSYVYALSTVSAFALVLYTTVLNIPREGRYMWLSPKPFSIPTLLYALTRYGILISLILAIWVMYVPAGSLCNGLTGLGNVMIFVEDIGIEGTVIIRVYALCQGNKVILWILIFLTIGNNIASFYAIAILVGCYRSSPGAKFHLISSVANILLVLRESFVFGVCLWNVWDAWKLKGETGIRNHNDLVSLIRRQVLSQFCFGIFFASALAIIDLIGLNTNVASVLGTFQQSLTAILIANFTLDLRQHNSAVIQASNVTLPTLHFRSVVDYMHQSIMVEMSDHENAIAMEDGDNYDLLPIGFPDVEIGPEEST